MLANLPALVVVVPLLTALLIPLVTRLSRRAAWWMVLLSVAFSAGGCIWLLREVHRGTEIVYAMGGWKAPTGIAYEIDGLNGIVLVMVAVVGLMTALWMRRSVNDEIHGVSRPSFYAVFLLSFAGLLGMTITADVFNVYVFLEIASITSYVLIASGRDRRSLYAGYSYLIVGSIGATFILLGIGHLYMATGSLGMADIAERLPELYDSGVVRTSFAFFTVGLAIKMALFPLHGWQPNAYEQAPSAASLFIAGTSTKVSAYVFYRLSFTVFGVDFLADSLAVIRDGVLVMAAAAIIVGPLLAVSQTNFKRLLAYSSVGQIGYVMLGVVLLNTDGVTGGLIHFWNHALAKGGLFAVAGILVFTTGAARVDSLAGLGRRDPWAATALTLAGASLVGLPLTAGFLSKYYLSLGALEAGRWFLVPLILISSLLTTVYVWRIVQLAWFTDGPRGDRKTPWSMRLPALAFAFGCVYFGLSSTGVDVARAAVEAMLR